MAEGDEWVEAGFEAIGKYFAGTEDEITDLLESTQPYAKKVDNKKFSDSYGLLLGLQAGASAGLALLSVANPWLIPISFPLVIDTITRMDDMKYGKKYTVTDNGSEVTMPVGIVAVIKDWYQENFD